MPWGVKHDPNTCDFSSGIYSSSTALHPEVIGGSSAYARLAKSCTIFEHPEFPSFRVVRRETAQYEHLKWPGGACEDPAAE